MSLQDINQSSCPPDCYPPSNIALGPSFHSGTTDPAPLLGNNGDVYINRTTCTIWRKVGGVWLLLGPLCDTKGQGFAFVQEDPPTVDDGIVEGSLWVDSLTGYLSYYNGTEWVLISDIVGFARYLHTTEVGVNTLVSTLDNPIIPSEPGALLYDLGDLLIDYQWAYNMTISTPTPSPITLTVADTFLPTTGVLPAIGVDDTIGTPVGTLNYTFEITQLPRILITYTETSGITSTVHQVAKDVPIDTLYVGSVGFTVGLGEIPVDPITLPLDLSTLAFTNDPESPVQFSVAGGVITATVDGLRMSTAGEFLISNVIDITPDSEIEIQSVQWGFPSGRLTITDASYQSTLTIGGATVVLSAPVFKPGLAADALVFEFPLEWLPLEGDTILDPPSIFGNGPTQWGYGTQLDVMLVNIRQSSALRKLNLNNFNLLGLQERKSKSSINKFTNKKQLSGGLTSNKTQLTRGSMANKKPVPRMAKTTKTGLSEGMQTNKKPLSKAPVPNKSRTATRGTKPKVINKNLTNKNTVHSRLVPLSRK